MHMDEAELTCRDYTKADGSKWHFDGNSAYDCKKMAETCSPGNCAYWDNHSGDGLHGSEACVYCGGGVCTATAKSGS